jgi:hypothetical protein
VDWCWRSKRLPVSTVNSQDRENQTANLFSVNCFGAAAIDCRGCRERGWHLYPGHVAFVLFQFDLRIQLVSMIRGAATRQTKPLLRARIPSDVPVFGRPLRCPIRLSHLQVYDRRLSGGVFGTDFFSLRALSIKDSIRRVSTSSEVVFASNSVLAALMSTISKEGAL